MTANSYPFQAGKLIRQYDKIILLIVFLFSHLVIWKIQGFILNDEAAKYIELGTKLYETGEFGEQKYITYLPVVLAVYVCRLFHLPLEVILALQCVLAFLAICRLYMVSKQLSNSMIGFSAAIFLTVCYPVQRWNLTLYSESIFISLNIFFLCQIFLWKDELYAKRGWIICWILALCISRPHGLLFIPSILILLFISSPKLKQRWSIAAISIGLITGMLVLTNLIFTGGADIDAMKPYKEQHVICYIPTTAKLPALDLTETGNVNSDLLYYITHNKIHFAKLTLLKLKSFFIVTRPHYSVLNNNFLRLLMLILYPLFLVGIFRIIVKPKLYTTYLIVTILIYAFGCTLQCDDWHGRFTSPILPHMILLAAVGLNYLQPNKAEVIILK